MERNEDVRNNSTKDMTYCTNEVKTMQLEDNAEMETVFSLSACAKEEMAQRIMVRNRCINTSHRLLRHKEI